MTALALNGSRAQRRGALLVAVSAAAFGALPIFARLSYDAGADLYGILVSRFAIGAAVLALIALARGARWPRGRTLLAVLAMGALGYTGQSFLYFSALRHADASLVALLLYSFPFMVALLAAAFLGERLDPARIAALVLASAGLAMTIGGGKGEPLGIVLGLGAALVYAVYIVVGSRVLRDADPIAASSLICAAAAASYGLIAAGRTLAGAAPAWPATVAGWVAVIALAVISTVLAIATFFAGLRRLGATLTSVVSTLEPVVSVALAAAVLAERLSPLQACGAAIVIGTAIWLALRPPPRA
jgi:drug/metabolite transporter (DMT)-like permease